MPIKIKLQEIVQSKFNNEREVESKFIIPLLELLGYSADDRHEQLSVTMQMGSKKQRGTADFVLFAKNYDKLSEQALLIVEAKAPKVKDLEEAILQAQSYAVAKSCYFGLVTNGDIIKAVKFFSDLHNKNNVVFECEVKDLPKHFLSFYNAVSKESMVRFYSKFI